MIDEDVSYSHLKVFGCKAFTHVPKEQCSKLDDKAVCCIFLGYGGAEFGYRLWDPEKRKIIRSRDVVFHEDQFFGDIEKTEKSKEVVNGVVDLTPTPSPVQTTGGEGGQYDPNHDEAQGLPNEQGVEQGEQSPQ